MQVRIIQEFYVTGGIFERTGIDDSFPEHRPFNPSGHLFQGFFKIRMIGHGGLDLNTV